jgi:hypothetical protein
MESKDLQRHELYAGVFRSRSWTSESLSNYFERLIKGSNVVECHFYPCTNPKLHGVFYSSLGF